MITKDIWNSKKNNKAFLKTMEAFLAIMIVFSFVVFFLPRDYRYPEDQSNFLLKNLEKNEIFRDCVAMKNETCIVEIIDDVFQGRFAFQFFIYQFAEPEVSIESSNVMVYTWFFAGDHNFYEPTTLKLYYWDAVLGYDGFSVVTPGLTSGRGGSIPPSDPDPEEPEPEPPEPEPDPDPEPDPEADFVFLNLMTIPSSVCSGTEINISIDVENVGDASGTHTVEFYVDSVLEGTDEVTVAPSETETAQITFFVGKVDTFAYSVETEADTFIATMCESLGPIFSFSNLRVDPPVVEPNVEFNILLDVENTGDEIGTHTVDFYVDGTLAGSDEVTVAPLSVEVANISHSVSGTGEHTYSAETESDTFTAGYFVVGP